MDHLLKGVALAGDVQGLYSIPAQNLNLEDVENIPFADTPLHIAAAAGNTHFAVEFMSLKPSFGKKLNPDGFSPLHLALHNNHVETVKRLVKHNPSLVRIAGRGRITPLHYAAEMNNVELLAEFLVSCPESIKDLTVSGDTAVHVAVRNRSAYAFGVLFGWIQRTNNKEILNWKNEEGNTALHLAVSTNQPQVVKLLVKNMNNLNDNNSQDLTALDVAMALPVEVNCEVKKDLRQAGALRASLLHKNVSLADFMSSRERIPEKFARYDVYMRMGLSREMRNTLLVVAILIATATYQAVLSPPGGVRHTTSINGGNTTITTTSMKSPSNDRPGTVALPQSSFNPFLYLNTRAYIGSAGLILFTVQNSRYSLLLQVSVIFLMLSYMVSEIAISPPSKVAAYTVIVSSILFIYARILGSPIPPVRWLFGGQRLQMQRQIVLSKYIRQ